MFLFRRFSMTVMAGLVLLSSTGINIFEHICNTENLKLFTLVKTSCKEDVQLPDCCKEGTDNSTKLPAKNKNCCHDKLVFVKNDIQNFYPKITEKSGSHTKSVIPYPISNGYVIINKHTFRLSSHNRYFAYTSPPYINNTSYKKLCIMRC